MCFCLFVVHVKWQNRECWMQRREAIQREQHLAGGDRLVSSIDKGLKGTSVLLLATRWNLHATICSGRLLASDGLSVWGVYRVRAPVSDVLWEGWNCKTTSKEYALKNNLKGKSGVRGWTGRQVSWLIARMDLTQKNIASTRRFSCFGQLIALLVFGWVAVVACFHGHCWLISFTQCFGIFKGTN